MTEEISDSAKSVKDELYQMIRENTTSGQSILIIGVGNTIGVSQWVNQKIRFLYAIPLWNVIHVNS